MQIHVLYVHSSFPGQFGPVAARLVAELGYTCTFVSRQEPGTTAGIRNLTYQPVGRVSASAHPCARAFEHDLRHAAGVYEALRPLRPRLHPELIVGHAGLGPTLFLADLYPDVPIIDYFEDFSPPERVGHDLRPEWPASEQDRLRVRPQNAMTLLHLEYCSAGYAPTRFQHGLLPEAYRSKIRVIHDGIDTRFWRRRPDPSGEFGSPRVVTYVSRTLDPLRGFDIFMRVAKRVYEAYQDVVFLVVGSDAEGYGDELRRVPEKSFKEHVLNQDDYDLERFRFLGWVRPEALVQILGMSDLHIYLTAPFALSWSLLDAMACGCVVLASDTSPVQEVIRHGENGLLGGFYDVDGLAKEALDVLERPHAYRDLGRAARRTVVERYSLDVVVPQMVRLYEDVVAAGA